MSLRGDIAWYLTCKVAEASVWVLWPCWVALEVGEAVYRRVRKR